MNNTSLNKCIKVHKSPFLLEKTEKSNFKIEKKGIIVKLRKILLIVPNSGPKKGHFLFIHSVIRGDSNIFQLASWEIENHNNFPILEEM